MNFYFFIFLLSVFSSFSYGGEKIKIFNPKGGWRDSTTDRIQFQQEVNYPDVRVKAPENQPNTGLIEGKIQGDIKKSEKLLKLIVNGNAMPLKTEGGRFKRPYVFGQGVNNVEIRTQDGKNKSKVQFYNIKKRGTPSRMRIILSWDTDGTDIDLHVVTPKGEHCYYGNRNLKDGSALDVDITTGYGPEIFSSPGSEKGTYLVYVNYYGRQSEKDLTIVNMTVITHEGSIDEKVETRRVPLRKPGELTFVYSFVYI